MDGDTQRTKKFIENRIKQDGSGLYDASKSFDVLLRALERFH